MLSVSPLGWHKQERWGSQWVQLQHQQKLGKKQRKKWIKEAVLFYQPGRQSWVVEDACVLSVAKRWRWQCSRVQHECTWTSACCWTLVVPAELTDNPGEGTHIESFHGLGGHQHQRCCSVVERASIGGGDSAWGQEECTNQSPAKRLAGELWRYHSLFGTPSLGWEPCWSQRASTLHLRTWACQPCLQHRPNISAAAGEAASSSGGVASTSLSNTNGYNLFGQNSGLVSCSAAAVGANGVGVLLLPADVALFGGVLCTVALVMTNKIHKYVYRKASPQEDSGVFGSSSSSDCRRPLWYLPCGTCCKRPWVHLWWWDLPCALLHTQDSLWT